MTRIENERIQKQSLVVVVAVVVSFRLDRFNRKRPPQTHTLAEEALFLFSRVDGLFLSFRASLRGWTMYDLRCSLQPSLCAWYGQTSGGYRRFLRKYVTQGKSTETTTINFR